MSTNENTSVAAAALPPSSPPPPPSPPPSPPPPPPVTPPPKQQKVIVPNNNTIHNNDSSKPVGQNSASDSDGSIETNSLSAESLTGDTANCHHHQQQEKVPGAAPTTHTAAVVVVASAATPITNNTNYSNNDNVAAATQATEKRWKKTRRGSEWEIMEGLRDGQRFDGRPSPFSGILHKKRKWPLKGWHKRYFLVEKGILVYGKSSTDLSRGKIHGSLDIGLSVISTKAKRRRIDIDAEEFIYHLKAKSDDSFNGWVHQLTAHRLYRQHVLTYGVAGGGGGGGGAAAAARGLNLLLGTSATPTPELSISRDGSLQRGLNPPTSQVPPPVVMTPLTVVGVAAAVASTQAATATVNMSTPPIIPLSTTNHSPNSSRLGMWLQEANVSLEHLQRESGSIEEHLGKLTGLLQQIETVGGGSSVAPPPPGEALMSCEATAMTVAPSPSIKKDRKKFGLKKRKSNKSVTGSTGSMDLNSAKSVAVTVSDTLPENTSPTSVNSLSSLCVTSPSQQSVTSSTTPSVAVMSSSLPIHFNPTGPDLFSTVSDITLTPASTLSPAVVNTTTVPLDTGQLREEFITVARNALTSIQTILLSLNADKERLKTVVEMEIPTVCVSQNVVNLRTSLTQVLQQNAELKSRLIRIHDASDLGDLSLFEPLSDPHRAFFSGCVGGQRSLSYSSSCMSGVEFFDAEDVPSTTTTNGGGATIIEGGGVCSSGGATNQRKKSTVAGAGGRPPPQQDDGATGGGGAVVDDGDIPEEESEVRTRSESSSEAGSLSSGEGSVISSESDLAEDLHPSGSMIHLSDGVVQGLTGRRTMLPAPRPPTEGLSLWNLLSRNIGKDLSQVSMPVELNEPLNVLQRLCEELEYSELLDRAAALSCPYERMCHVAAFAVSSYASTVSRAGNKPFNPLLGETFECIRGDRGFRFIAEQVSHHPPVSACHAISRNFVFWQEARVKTKFWGKSMEFLPVGRVHVSLPLTGEQYTWNKVTTCVHNLFSGQRWVDQYGELTISSSDGISCKLTFSKATYWSSKRHEVVGAVYDENGQPVRRLFGKWSEALYSGVAPNAQCIWWASTRPEDNERYYGFTRFAIELNELRADDIMLLPPTDSRFRPDQRALEEGDVCAAKTLKSQLECAQRDRRRHRDECDISYTPRWFEMLPTSNDTNGDTCWQYNGKYWEMRKNPGFSQLQFEALW